MGGRDKAVPGGVKAPTAVTVVQGALGAEPARAPCERKQVSTAWRLVPTAASLMGNLRQVTVLLRVPFPSLKRVRSPSPLRLSTASQGCS